MKQEVIEDFDDLVYPQKDWRLGTVNVLVNKGRYFEFSFHCAVPEIREKVISEWGDKVEISPTDTVYGPKANVKHVIHVLNKYGFNVKRKDDWI